MKAYLIRYEPCWMALGQAAGIAAAVAVQTGLPVQELPVGEIQDRLLDENASLIWFKDVPVTSPDFKMVQKMALAGYIPEWEARLDRDATPDEKEGFESLSGIDIPENMNSRREILEYIYERL